VAPMRLRLDAEAKTIRATVTSRLGFA